MGWTEGDEARKVHKFLVGGVYEPEDITRREFKLLQKYFPKDAHFVQWWLENRQEMIEEGEWTENHEPQRQERRIVRYEKGDGIVDPWDG